MLGVLEYLYTSILPVHKHLYITCTLLLMIIIPFLYHSHPLFKLFALFALFACVSICATLYFCVNINRSKWASELRNLWNTMKWILICSWTLMAEVCDKSCLKKNKYKLVQIEDNYHLGDTDIRNYHWFCLVPNPPF